MYGVTNYISTYIAYNLGYNLSLNLDFQVYDNSLSGPVEEEEDVFSFKAEFNEEEIIDGEDLIDIKLPPIPDLSGKVHDFTVFEIDEEIGLHAKIEEMTKDIFDTGYKDEEINEDEFATNIVEVEDISPVEFDAQSTESGFKEEAFLEDEYEVEQKEEAGLTDEYDIEREEEIADVDVFDFDEANKHKSFDLMEKELIKAFEEEVERGFAEEEYNFRRHVF